MKRLKLLYNIIRERAFWFVGAIALLLVSVFIRTFEPKIVQVIIDNLLKDKMDTQDYFVQKIFHFLEQLPNQSLKYKIIILCGFYVILAGCRSVFILISRAISYSAAEKSIKEFRVSIFNHIQRIPISSFNILNKGELIQRSTGDIDTIKNFISNHTIELIRLGTLFIFSTYMLFQINVEYAFWSVSLCPIIFLSTYLFFKYEGKVWKIHEDEADKLTNIAQENLNGIRTVKAYNKIEDEIRKFEIQNNRKLEAGMKNIRLHTLFWPMADFLTFIQTIIFVILGGIFVLNHQMTIGGLVVAYTYNSMMTFPLRQAGRILSQMSMALVAMDRIQHILSIPLESDEGKNVENLKGNIVFDNLSFRYSDSSAWVLNNISLEIKEGEKIAIMGGSASGKSTLAKLLLRLHEPSQGSILIDNYPIYKMNLTSLRNRIGIVMQQSVLFSMNVGNNLAYANENSSFEDKHTMLQTAGFENYETMLPKGLDTEIGEKGVSLSGGQKQRLALARTLIKENDILILDDITSALDKETEKKVLKNVFEMNQNKTILIITHRISTLSKVDRVLVLDAQGSIQCYGNPKDLIKTNSFLIELDKIEKNNIEILQTQN